MKRTSQELLDFYGLKVGDKVRFNGKVYDVFQHETLNDFVYLRQDNEQGTRTLISHIAEYEYTIIRTPQLTEDEKVILKNLPEEYKWIARDGDGALYVHDDNPERFEGEYYNNWISSESVYIVYDNLFTFIKWEDEPYEIKDLLDE